MMEKRFAENWVTVVENTDEECFDNDEKVIDFFIQKGIWANKNVDMFYEIRNLLELSQYAILLRAETTRYMYIQKNDEIKTIEEKPDEDDISAARDKDVFVIYKIVIDKQGIFTIQQLEVEELEKPKYFRLDTVTCSQNISTEVKVLVEVDEYGNEISDDAEEIISSDWDLRDVVKDALEDEIDSDFFDYETSHGRIMTKEEAQKTEDEVINFDQIDWEE